MELKPLSELPRRPYLPHGGAAPPLPRWHSYVAWILAIVVLVPGIAIPLAELTGIGTRYEGSLFGPRWPDEGFQVRSTAIPELESSRPAERYEVDYDSWALGFDFGLLHVIRAVIVLAACAWIWRLERLQTTRLSRWALVGIAALPIAACWASERLHAHFFRVHRDGQPFSDLLTPAAVGPFALLVFLLIAAVAAVAIARMVRSDRPDAVLGLTVLSLVLSLRAVWILDFGVVGAPQMRPIPGLLKVDMAALDVGDQARWLPTGGLTEDAIYVQVTDDDGPAVLRVRHTQPDGGWEAAAYDGPLAGSSSREWLDALDTFAARAVTEDLRKPRSEMLQTSVWIEVDHDLSMGAIRPLLSELQARRFWKFPLLHAGPGCTEVRFTTAAYVVPNRTFEQPPLRLGLPPTRPRLAVADQSYESLAALERDPNAALDLEEPLAVIVHDDVPWGHVVQLAGALNGIELRLEEAP